MASRSWRDRLPLAVAVPIAVVVTLWVGPAYLQPLPIWMKLVLAAAGCCVIATIAIYSRRRAR
jgi:hypothetical protein